MKNLTEEDKEVARLLAPKAEQLYAITFAETLQDAQRKARSIANSMECTGEDHEEQCSHCCGQVYSDGQVAVNDVLPPIEETHMNFHAVLDKVFEELKILQRKLVRNAKAEVEKLPEEVWPNEIPWDMSQSITQLIDYKDVIAFRRVYGEYGQALYSPRHLQVYMENTKRWEAKDAQKTKKFWLVPLILTS